MQVSHMLLTNAEQCRELFGGAGFIPDIRKLPNPYCPAAYVCTRKRLLRRQAAPEFGLRGSCFSWPHWHQ